MSCSPQAILHTSCMQLRVLARPSAHAVLTLKCVKRRAARMAETSSCGLGYSEWFALLCRQAVYQMLCHFARWESSDWYVAVAWLFTRGAGSCTCACVRACVCSCACACLCLSVDSPCQFQCMCLRVSVCLCAHLRTRTRGHAQLVVGSCVRAHACTTLAPCV